MTSTQKLLSCTDGSELGCRIYPSEVSEILKPTLKMNLKLIREVFSKVNLSGVSLCIITMLVTEETPGTH